MVSLSIFCKPARSWRRVSTQLQRDAGAKRVHGRGALAVGVRSHWRLGPLQVGEKLVLAAFDLFCLRRARPEGVIIISTLINVRNWD